MGLFDSLARTVANVAVLPLRIAVDTIEAPARIMSGEQVGTHTAEGLDNIVDDLVK